MTIGGINSFSCFISSFLKRCFVGITRPVVPFIDFFHMMMVIIAFLNRYGTMNWLTLPTCMNKTATYLFVPHTVAKSIINVRLKSSLNSFI